jgi:hypothetical protein
MNLFKKHQISLYRRVLILWMSSLGVRSLIAVMLLKFMKRKVRVSALGASINSVSDATMLFILSRGAELPKSHTMMKIQQMKTTHNTTS